MQNPLRLFANLAVFTLAFASSLNAQSTPPALTLEPVRSISVGAEGNILNTPPVGTVPIPSPPRPPASIVKVEREIESLHFTDNLALNYPSLFIPPDPIGAASINRVAAVVNSMIEVRNKGGQMQWRTSLRTFFASVAPQRAPFDPKIVYDHYRGRFVVVALEQFGIQNNQPQNRSRILLAVSKTDAPDSGTTADWYFAAIDSKLSVSGIDFWADYPGFEVDEEAVYVTANMFSFDSQSYAGVRLWIVNKSGFYDGGALAFGRYDPYATAGFPTTTMPAEVHGAGGVGGPGSTVGTFLVAYSGLTEGGATGQEAVQVITIRDPLGRAGGPTFIHQFVLVGNLENLGGSFGFPALPDAPQAGTATRIEVNDRRALDAVWRDNSLWLTTTINPNSGPDAGQTTAHWFRLNTTNLTAITLADQGNIGGEDIAPDTYTFMAAIGVNRRGAMIVGFAASAPTIYPGAFATGRAPTDAPGTVRPTALVHAGEDYYVRTFGAPRNRWGDYSGVAIDPTNEDMGWVFNQYAAPRGTVIVGEDGQWGTAWGRAKFQR